MSTSKLGKSKILNHFFSLNSFFASSCFFFSFTTVTKDGLLSGFDGKYKVHGLFIVTRFSTEIRISIQGLLTDIRKPITKTCLAIVKHDWTSIVWQRINRNHFPVASCTIWNFKLALPSNTICLMSTDVSIEISIEISCYSHLVLYPHVMKWSKAALNI